jgi:isoleucyl-tRNA synthetase
VCDAVSKLEHDAVSDLVSTGQVVVQGETILLADVDIQFNFRGDRAVFEAATSPSGDLLAVLNKTLTPECQREGVARELMNRVQKLRKTAAVSYEDRVAVYYRAHGASPKVADALEHLAEFIRAGIRIDLLPTAAAPDAAAGTVLLEEETDVEEEKFTLYLVRLA